MCDSSAGSPPDPGNTIQRGCRHDTYDGDDDARDKTLREIPQRDRVLSFIEIGADEGVLKQIHFRPDAVHVQSPAGIVWNREDELAGGSDIDMPVQ